MGWGVGGRAEEGGEDCIVLTHPHNSKTNGRRYYGERKRRYDHNQRYHCAQFYYDPRVSTQLETKLGDGGKPMYSLDIFPAEAWKLYNEHLEALSLAGELTLNRSRVGQRFFRKQQPENVIKSKPEGNQCKYHLRTDYVLRALLRWLRRNVSRSW